MTCTKGIWNDTIPGVVFDENGVSNYAKLQQSLMSKFPRGDVGKRDWDALVLKMKQDGVGKPYDCIIGVSGGTDSSYLLHLTHQEGLRALAINLDNGWSSDIAVKNIKKVTSALGIDLETYVIDYEEVKEVLRAYIRARLPWIDFPTDYAIHATFYRTAAKEGLKYVLTGSDFRSEGKQPSEWTYGDYRQFKHVLKVFGSGRKLSTYPILPFERQLYYGYFKGIKQVAPFYYLPYQKKEAQKLLETQYGWEYYGGHHHENVFTKFAIGYWMYKKFGYDKRLITLSAQVLSGEISREEALEKIQLPPYDLGQMELDREYVIKKLGMTAGEFEKVWRGSNKLFKDYPSYYPMIERGAKVLTPIAKLVLPQTPKIFLEIEQRKSRK